MNYLELDAGETIMDVGDQADNFYIILNGTVSVQIRNEIIDNWEWAHCVYTALKKWKREDFDKKLEKKIEDKMKAQRYIENKRIA